MKDQMLTAIDKHDRALDKRMQEHISFLKQALKKAALELQAIDRDRNNVQYLARKALLSGHTIALLDIDFDLLSESESDEDAFDIDYIGIPVTYLFELGGYKWREVLDVSVYDDIGKIHDKINESCPAKYERLKILITLADLAGIEVDKDKVDLSGSGVYHKEVCNICVILCALK